MKVKKKKKKKKVVKKMILKNMGKWFLCKKNYCLLHDVLRQQMKSHDYGPYKRISEHTEIRLNISEPWKKRGGGKSDKQNSGIFTGQSN